jgi:rubrerythrin
MNVDKFDYPENLSNAMELMQQALNGEVEDQMFYMWLISNAPSEEERQIIGSIRDDEMGHFELFRQIYYDLTGMSLRQNSEETFMEPESYCEGLARAIIGEQNAVREYRKILYAMQSRIHINMLIDIITDETRHGILYNYLFARNACR